MYQWLFRNKWVAIAFVILTLASVQALVGREGEGSVISRTKSQLIERHDKMQEQIGSMSADPAAPVVIPGPPTAVETGFAEDDDLIDDATGFDPTPDAEQPDDPSVDLGEGDQADEYYTDQ